MCRSINFGLFLLLIISGCATSDGPVQFETPLGSDESVSLETGECGDGLIQPTELCDGTNVGGVTCELLGYGPGEIACVGGCQTFDTSGCSDPVCGDGIIQSGEACEGDDIDGWTCELLGFVGGTLTCSEDCGLDPSACVQAEPCDCPESWLADGLCDDGCNAAACGYDGGDCCPSTCEGGACGSWGWVCEDPAACENTGECDPAPEYEDPWSDEGSWDDGGAGCNESWIGDGWCDPNNNHELCEWDGGDCCPSTCSEDAPFECGNFGWDCQDPTACENTGECEPAPESDPWGDDGWDDGWDDDGWGSNGECYEPWSGDGWCDMMQNTEACQWDGGDCCASTCPGCDEYLVWLSEVMCLDPEACENSASGCF